MARAERSGAGAFLVRPLGGGGEGKAQHPFERVAPDRGAGTWPGSPAAAGAVQPWRRYQRLHRPVRGRLRRQAYLCDSLSASHGRWPPRAASSWQCRRGQLPAVARAHRRGCHDASVRACDEELSTRVGEKGAHQQVNGCCQGDLGGVLVEGAGGRALRSSATACGRGGRGNDVSSVPEPTWSQGLLP